MSGILLVRNKRINKYTGDYEIMQIHIVHAGNHKCISLKFTIFDYAKKKFIHQSYKDNIDGLNEFDAKRLKELA